MVSSASASSLGFVASVSASAFGFAFAFALVLSPCLTWRGLEVILISDVGVSEVELVGVELVSSFNAVEPEEDPEGGGDVDEEEPLVGLSRKGKTFPR